MSIVNQQDPNLELAKETLFVCKNPYIHGTQLSVLSGLVHTGFVLVNARDLVQHHNIGTVSGEIDCGGWSIPLSLPKQSFGRVHGKQNCTYYDLESVLRYTKMGTHNIRDISYSVGRAHRVCYSNTREVLLLVAQQLSLGTPLTQLPIDQQYIDNARVILQFMDVILHVNKSVFGNNQDSQMKHVVRQHMTYRHLYDRLMLEHHGVDFSSNHPEVVQKIVNLFCVPPVSITDVAEYASNNYRRVQLQDARSMLPINEDSPPKHVDVGVAKDRFEPHYLAYRLFQDVGGYSINEFLYSYLDGRVSNSFFDEFREIVHGYRTALAADLQLLEDILLGRHVIMKLDTNDVRNPANPLIFVLQDDNLVEVFQGGHGEYRATKPLALGSDIKMIAVQNEDDRQDVVRYLAKHGLDCAVVLIETLAALDRPAEIV